jgi:hypothetical protein
MFSSPTLRVEFTAHVSNPNDEATAAHYAVVLSVTSQNGSDPLSGSDGVDDFEISVLKSGVDVGDLVIADHAVYLKVDLANIDPNGYQGLVGAADRRTANKPGSAIAEAFLTDQWVGIDDTTLASFVKQLVKSPPTAPHIDNLRNAFKTSFAQSWDTWASIHQVSSSNGTIEYSLDMPVRNFVASFVRDLRKPLEAALPSAKSLFTNETPLIATIPASLKLPITMWVTNGSLTELNVSYKGDSLDLAISHPSVGVTAPQGAAMITTDDINGLLNDYGICPPGASGWTGYAPASGLSGVTGSSGLTGSRVPSTCSCGSSAVGTSGGVTPCLGLGGGGLFGLGVGGIRTRTACSLVHMSGSSGVSGISSIAGPSGISSISGLGTNGGGFTCPSGTSGTTGGSGPSGLSGTSGGSGSSGTTGTSPKSGASGVSGTSAASGSSKLPG